MAIYIKNNEKFINEVNKCIHEYMTRDYQKVGARYFESQHTYLTPKMFNDELFVKAIKKIISGTDVEGIKVNEDV